MRTTAARRRKVRFWLTALAATALLLAVGMPAPGGVLATLTVNTTDDELNSDGDCSLREAITAANTDANVDACGAGSGTDLITVPAGFYLLSVAGAGEQNAATGDLDVLEAVDIIGAGSGATVIDANGIDRVFDVVGGDLEVVGAAIRNGNPNDSGGGINGGPLTLTDVVVAGNTTGAAGNGGGIRIYTGQALNLTDVAIKSNSTGGAGGGIAGDTNAQMTLTRVTINNNTATDGDGGGGGIAGGSGTLTNVTITGNSGGGATPNGGIRSDGTLSLTNVTVASNPGFGLNRLAGTLTLKNTIVSGNGTNCNGTITSAGHNIDSANTCAFTGTGDLVNTDPLLGALGDNGGPTHTMALGPGSPAIDAGDAVGAPGTDQRLVARPQGAGIDIGAYEATAATFLVDRTDDSAAATACTTAPNDCSLRGAVMAANAQANVGSQPDVIQVPASTYGLTIGGSGEDAAATGDLDVTEAATITGAGPGATIVDGNDLDRVIHVVSGVGTTLEHLTVTDGSEFAGFCGGGIRATGTGTTFTDVAVVGNVTFGGGGGLCVTGAGPTLIEDSLFAGNSANGNGGAIRASDVVTIVDTRITGSSANDNAAIAHGTGGTLTLNRVTVDNNAAASINSGVAKCGGTLTVTNSTFSNNAASAGTNGNVIDTNDAVTTLNNVTVADNGSPALLAGSGACGGGPNTMTVRNSILANNGAQECAGTITAIYSLIETLGTCTLSGTSANNVIGSDPNLGALATVAPGTTPIRPLMLPSPAYNAASPAAYNSGGDSCLGIDQQTEARNGGGRCDMGADELLVPDLKQTKTDAPDPVVLGSGTDVVYTLTTKNLGGATAHNVAVTDPLPPSMTFVSAPGCVYTGGTHTVDCALGDLLPGAVVVNTITVTPTASGTVSNTATATMTETDPTPANNAATQKTKVVGLKTLTFVPPIGIGGCSLQGKVTLTSAAPTGGVTVSLSDTHPSADVPASVIVPGGSGSALFPITNPHVTSNQVGNVTATLFGNSKIKSLTVRPIGVKTLVLAPNPVTGGNPVTGTVTLDCAATVNVTVSTTSNKPGVAQPTNPSFVITTGNNSGAFNVDTFPVGASTIAKITATANGIAKSKLLTVNP